MLEKFKQKKKKFNQPKVVYWFKQQ